MSEKPDFERLFALVSAEAERVYAEGGRKGYECWEVRFHEIPVDLRSKPNLLRSAMAAIKEKE